jgi:MarR family transcriptional regulator, organic hydroperoxide resistance regulator
MAPSFPSQFIRVRTIVGIVRSRTTKSRGLEPNHFAHRSPASLGPMPDRHTLAETERAMTDHVSSLSLDFKAAHALSNLFRAANAVRQELTNRVLRNYDITWTGFVVLWVVWIWDGMETRHAAESAGISKATLTGVVKTLEGQGWITRETGATDRRLVNLKLTEAGSAMMRQLYPAFNAAESDVVACLSQRAVADLTRSLRLLVRHLESEPEQRIKAARGA